MGWRILDLGGSGGGKGDFIWILSSVFLDGINVGNEVPSTWYQMRNKLFQRSDTSRYPVPNIFYAIPTFPSSSWVFIGVGGFFISILL